MNRRPRIVAAFTICLVLAAGNLPILAQARELPAFGTGKNVVVEAIVGAGPTTAEAVASGPSLSFWPPAASGPLAPPLWRRAVRRATSLRFGGAENLSATAAPDLSAGKQILPGEVNARRPIGTLLEQAHADVDTVTPAMRVNTTRAGRVQNPKSSVGGGRSKTWLTVGLIGVGTAVAGVFVYEKKEYALPGLVGGREIAGQSMIFGGAVFAGLGFWKAFSD